MSEARLNDEYPLIWFDKEDILHIDYGDCERITQTHAIKIAEYIKDIPAKTGKKIKVINHAKKLIEIDPKAQKLFFSNEFAYLTEACAAAGHPTGFNAPLGEPYEFFETSPYPFQFFTEEEAMLWLRTFEPKC